MKNMKTKKIAKKKVKMITGEELDAMFDRGEDVMQYMDLSSIKAVNTTRRITIDFPNALLAILDSEAAKIGVTRTALIKMWVEEQLQKHIAQREASKSSR